MPTDKRIRKIPYGSNEIWVKEYASILPQKECYTIIGRPPSFLRAKLPKHPGLKFAVDIYRQLKMPLSAIDFQKSFSVILYPHFDTIEKFNLSIVASNLGAVLALKVDEINGRPLLYIVDPTDLPEVFTVSTDGKQKLIHINSGFRTSNVSTPYVKKDEIDKLREYVEKGQLVSVHIEIYGLWDLCEPIIYDALQYLEAILSGEVPFLRIPTVLRWTREKLAYVEEKYEMQTNVPQSEKVFTELCREAVMYLTNLTCQLTHLPHFSDRYESKLEELFHRCRNLSDLLFLEWSFLIENCIAAIFQKDLSAQCLPTENKMLHLFTKVTQLLTYAILAEEQTRLAHEKKIKLFVSRIERVANFDLAVEKIRKIFHARYPDIRLVFGAEGYFGEDLEKRLFYFVYVSDALLATFLKEPLVSYDGAQKNYNWVIKESSWADVMQKKVIRIVEKGASKLISPIFSKENVIFNLENMETDPSFLHELDSAVANLREKIAKDRLVLIFESLHPNAKKVLKKLFEISKDEIFVTPGKMNDSFESDGSIKKHLDRLVEITSKIAWASGTPLVTKVRIKKKDHYKSNIASFVQATLSYFSYPSIDTDIITRLLEVVFKVKAKTENELKLTLNAQKLLLERYLLKGLNGNVVETPVEMLRRVAETVAAADLLYDPSADIRKIADDFYQLLASLDFLPNSPTLMNAGLEEGQLSACFVLPIEDSLDEIFDALKMMVRIQKTGGGTGFSFHNLRPEGDIVKSTKGVSSGPVSFLAVFDKATDVIKQGGRRRGANMGILKVDHPDILKFIHAKEKGGLTNFNISVAISNEFMSAVEKDEEYCLVNPRNKKTIGKLRATYVFDLIARMAWMNGDPGIVFLDKINRHNPTPLQGPMESTNPCGEQPLLPYESCNLGSINLANMIKKGEVDWNRLKKVVNLAVHFLDNVIDVNEYPSKKIEQVTKANRKIGLGVMGWAEMLIKLGVPYDSEEALKKAENIMKFISEKARYQSVELAKQRGSFHNFRGSIWEDMSYKELRNATIITIAPTGSISIIAGCSSSIEPLFAIWFTRNVANGTVLSETNPLFERIAKERGFYSKDLMVKIAKAGSIQSFEEIPMDIKRIFVTAHDISSEWHVKMQAAFQNYCDNAVSKTVNLPHDATVEDVKRIFRLAYELECKGITVYRYGSKEGQVLTIGSEYAGGCPDRQCPV